MMLFTLKKAGFNSAFAIFIFFTQKTETLRAQQSPCYEFLCGSEEALLCGSNKVTYLNGCIYSQAQCKDPSLFVVHPGACSKDNATTVAEIETEHLEASSTPSINDVVTSTTGGCDDSFCPATYKPVCGSEGITYANMCQFIKAQCRTPGLELKHEGRCKSYENCLTRICPMREDSLCASDGKTYRNLCELSIAKCYNPSLVPVSNGPCDIEVNTPNLAKCDNPCEDMYRPVCGTDGKTYANVCYFENAKCKNHKLKIYKFEPC